MFRVCSKLISLVPNPACLVFRSRRVSPCHCIAYLQYNSKVRLGRGFNVEELKVSQNTVAAELDSIFLYIYVRNVNPLQL